MNARDLAAEALRLDMPERAELAQCLLDSLDELPPSEQAKLWADEAERRDRAVDAGDLSESSAAVVLERLRHEIG